MQREKSALFLHVVNNLEPTLKHPTASSFDPKTWISVFARCNHSLADSALLAAGLFFGREISLLRKYQLADTLCELNQVDSIRLAIATCNRTRAHILSHVDAQMAAQFGKDTPLHPQAVADIRIPTILSNSTPDGVLTSVVDSLPHWFALVSERAKERADRLTEGGQPDFGKIHAKSALFLSLERTLRDLWQQALWEPWNLDISDLTFRPSNKAHTGLWTAWQARQDAISSQAFMLDMLLEIREDDTTEVNPQSVISASYKSGRYRTRLSKPTKRQRHNQIHSMRIFENSYLGFCLDEQIHGTSCSVRMLLKAWIFLDSMARALLNAAGPHEIRLRHDVKRLSLELPLERVISELAVGLGINTRLAREIVAQLTLDPLDVSSAFQLGVWHRPLVKHPTEDRVMINAAVLTSVNPIHLLERVFKATGLQRSLEKKSLGVAYEADLRNTLQTALSENPILMDSFITTNAVGRERGKGEEIDIVIRVGSCVIVGEVKCFVCPNEPIDRFNYLEKLEDAAKQVSRKCVWLSQNPTIACKSVNLDLSEISECKFVPVVILNNGIGTGLTFNDVIVTDAHWLKVVFSDGQYSAGVKRDFGTGEFTSKSYPLYRSEAEFRKNVVTILSEPPMLKEFNESLRWGTIQLPTSDDGRLTVSDARLDNSALANTL